MSSRCLNMFAWFMCLINWKGILYYSKIKKNWTNFCFILGFILHLTSISSNTEICWNYSIHGFLSTILNNINFRINVNFLLTYTSCLYLVHMNKTTIRIQTGYMAYPFTCLYCLPMSTLHYYSQYISCKEEFVVIIHKLLYSHLIIQDFWSMLLTNCPHESI